MLWKDPLFQVPGVSEVRPRTVVVQHGEQERIGLGLLKLLQRVLGGLLLSVEQLQLRAGPLQQAGQQLESSAEQLPVAQLQQAGQQLQAERESAGGNNFGSDKVQRFVGASAPPHAHSCIEL